MRSRRCNLCSTLLKGHPSMDAAGSLTPNARRPTWMTKSQRQLGRLFTTSAILRSMQKNAAIATIIRCPRRPGDLKRANSRLVANFQRGFTDRGADVPLASCDRPVIAEKMRSSWLINIQYLHFIHMRTATTIWHCAGGWTQKHAGFVSYK